MLKGRNPGGQVDQISAVERKASAHRISAGDILFYPGEGLRGTSEQQFVVLPPGQDDFLRRQPIAAAVFKQGRVVFMGRQIEFDRDF